MLRRKALHVAQLTLAIYLSMDRNHGFVTMHTNVWEKTAVI